MEAQTIQVTPVASTPSALRRGYGNMLSLPALVALSVDRNGSDMPAFAAQIDADAQSTDEPFTVKVNVPSEAYGMSFASGATRADGSLVVLAKLDRALLTAPQEKLQDAADMVRDLFDSDGNVRYAPADYRTALLPASPASDDQVLVTIADGQVTEIELPFTGTPEIARISARKVGKREIPAAYVVGKVGDTAVFAADEQDAIGNKPTWAEIARFDSPISAIARENSENELIMQLDDGSYRKVVRSEDGYQVSEAEIEDDSAIPVGAAYLGLTSAWGNGKSHALFAAYRQAGQPTVLTFVPKDQLPPAWFCALQA